MAENQDGVVMTDPGNTAQAEETVLQSSETGPAVARTPAVAISEPREPAAVPEDESLLIWENDTLAYEFTSAGGGIKTVILKQYQETTKCSDEESEETTETDHVRLNVNVPTPALNLFFGKLDNGFLPYTLKQEDDEISTIGGLVYSIINRIPKNNEVIKTDDNLIIRIIKSNNRKIETVEVKKIIEDI